MAPNIETGRVQSKALRIGTRGSPLALYQANLVRDLLSKAHGLEPDAVEIVPIRTTGDRITDRPLADVGGKGLFTKEIEEALLDGRIDLAVHSAKDCETALRDGLVLAAFPPRADPRDAFLSSQAADFRSLPHGAVLGSSSVRRRAMALSYRPDLKLVDLRGNVETRLAKLQAGIADATILALAGLQRLGLEHHIRSIIDPEIMLPAAGQGVIAIECRMGDERVRTLLAAIDHAETHAALLAERAFLAILDGSCRTPIGALAAIGDGRLSFAGMLAAVDGSEAHRIRTEGAVADAERLGREAAREVLAAAGPNFIKA